MKNTLLNTVLLATTILYAGAANAYTSYEYDKNGNISKETTYTGQTITAEKIYENGNLMSDLSYDSTTGKLSSGQEYTYDADGNIATKKDYKNGSLNTSYAYTYDSKGNMETLTSVSSTGAENTTTYTNTYTNGILTKTEKGTPDSITYTTIEYEYTDDGKTETLSYYIQGTLNNKYVTTYDTDGNILQYTQETPSSGIVYSETYTYKDGQVATKSLYSYGQVIENTYTYTDGQLTEETESYNTLPYTLSTQYTYDNGNLTSKTTYRNYNGMTFKLNQVNYTYQYDKYGNIIEKWSGNTLSERYSYADPTSNAIMKIYTLEEAYNATTKGNNNTFSIRFK